MEQKIWKIKEVMAYCRISRTTVYRLIEQGKFPVPIRLSKQARAWRVKDIEAWLESRETA